MTHGLGVLFHKATIFATVIVAFAFADNVPPYEALISIDAIKFKNVPDSTQSEFVKDLEMALTNSGLMLLKTNPEVEKNSTLSFRQKIGLNVVFARNRKNVGYWMVIDLSSDKTPGYSRSLIVTDDTLGYKEFVNRYFYKMDMPVLDIHYSLMRRDQNNEPMRYSEEVISNAQSRQSRKHTWAIIGIAAQICAGIVAVVAIMFAAQSS